MTTAPLILAFDTSGPHCLAALCRGETVLVDVDEPLARGQAERLMPLLQDILAAENATWGDISALGVGTGPGNFTGIRIAVSAARGLAFGLCIPAVGVSGCEARALLPGARHAIPAPRNQAYLCDPQDTANGPQRLPLDDLPPGTIVAHNPEGLAPAIARVALSRWETTITPPVPLYLRPADAAPARDLPPKILDA